jgi:hypothetical protein
MQDYAPPTFEGLQFANPISATQIDLFWDPAYDYCTLEEDFVYQIYRAETSGEQNFASPTYTTDQGAISFSVTGLQPGTDYFFVVRATDSNGNQDSNSIEIPATTPDDTDPPFIVSVSPQDGSLDVPTNTVITVTFSEPIDPSSFASAFTLVEVVNGDPIYGPMTYSGTTVTFSPPNGLSSESSYEATVTTGVTDLAGNTMQADYIWSFTTAPDLIPPYIVSVTPQGGTQNVPTDTVITVTFSEPIDPSTINTSFTLYYTPVNTTEPRYVQCAAAYSGTTATFTPLQVFFHGQRYFATVTTEVTDLAGNHMLEHYGWYFDVSP